MKNYKAIGKRIKSPPKTTKHINAVFYGKAGTGKTTLSATFPKPLFLVAKENDATAPVKNVKGLKELQIDEWSDLQDAYWYLRKEKHDFKSVVIDTAGGAQLFAIEEVMKRHKKKGKPGDWGTMTQKMWGEVANMMKELMLNFRDLNMHVVFIAHDRVFKAKDEEDEDGDIVRIAPHVGPALSPSIASTLNAACNMICECFIGEEYKTVKDKKTKKKKLKRSIKYCLRVGPHSAYMTKVRKLKEVKLPDIIEDPDFDELIELIA